MSRIILALRISAPPLPSAENALFQESLAVTSSQLTQALKLVVLSPVRSAMVCL
jgi:hypothetical protein